jgi:hypothetical protein
LFCIRAGSLRWRLGLRSKHKEGNKLKLKRYFFVLCLTH